MADEGVTSSIQMVLVDPEGNEHIYEPVLTMGFRGKDYIVLEPVQEGGESELQIMGFHAGPDDELILHDIEDDDLYAEIAEEAEAILNGEAETEEYLIDDGTMSEEERAEINQEMYEAAKVDGANRWKQIWTITLPSIAPTVTIMFILAVGGLLNTNFDQILVLNNPLNAPRSNVLDIFVYQTAMRGMRYSYASAIGLFKSVIAFILLFIANQVTKRLNDTSLF